MYHLYLLTPSPTLRTTAIPRHTVAVRLGPSFCSTPRVLPREKIKQISQKINEDPAVLANISGRELTPILWALPTTTHRHLHHAIGWSKLFLVINERDRVRKLLNKKIVTENVK